MRAAPPPPPVPARRALELAESRDRRTQLEAFAERLRTVPSNDEAAQRGRSARPRGVLAASGRSYRRRRARGRGARGEAAPEPELEPGALRARDGACAGDGSRAAGRDRVVRRT